MEELYGVGAKVSSVDDISGICLTAQHPVYVVTFNGGGRGPIARWRDVDAAIAASAIGDSSIGNCSDSGGKQKVVHLVEGIEAASAPGGEEREAGGGIACKPPSTIRHSAPVDPSTRI